jgi:hypothetical protein
MLGGNALDEDDEDEEDDEEDDVGNGNKAWSMGEASADKNVSGIFLESNPPVVSA